MTGPSRDSIDQVGAALAELLRDGLRRDGVKAAVSLGLARAARPSARVRLAMVLHRAVPDVSARNAMIESGHPEFPGTALRLGFVAVVRGPGEAGDLRALTSAIRSLEAAPVLGPASRWRLTVEGPGDDLRLAFFAAARLAVSPCVWFEVTGIVV